MKTHTRRVVERRQVAFMERVVHVFALSISNNHALKHSFVSAEGCKVLGVDDLHI